MLSGFELRDALLGTVIEGSGGARFHIREPIGEGGQGWVFRANYGDPHGFWVVVKVLRPDSVAREALARFEREAQVLRRLATGPTPVPNVVRFYDHGRLVASAMSRTVELPFIALEHVAGQTLAEVIRAHGGFGLPILRVRRVMRQVARALSAVHDQRIVHRDLKPSNVLLAQQDGEEIAKVTDFGLVKLPDLTAHRTVSIAGASLGYAPPEQYEMGNPRVGPPTDVFSFASVLYELLSGTPAFPFHAEVGPLRVVARILTGERPSLARVHATVPRELRERADLTAALDLAVSRALHPDPGLRHASIRELWEEVEPLLDRALDRPDALDGTAAFAPVPAARVSIADAAPAWRVIGRPLNGEKLRTAVVARDRHSIVAAGVHGLYRFADGAWSAMRLPSDLAADALRGLTRTPRGDLVLFGDRGFAAVLARGGALERIPLGEDDVTLVDASADEHGLLFVGERSSVRRGALVEVPIGGAPEVRSLDGASRPRGVARLSGGSIVVCGEQGALVYLGARPEGATRLVAGGGDPPPQAIAWGRTGHLYAIAPCADGGAFAVGSGGHALRISPPSVLPGLAAPPAATLEAVQTTRDLANVVLDDDGIAWAAGGHARLLQRRNGTWTRILVEPAGDARLLAVMPRRDGITVLVEDGTVLEGPATLEPPNQPATSSRARPATS